MKDTGSPNDSWAYQSIQSVARPSWMEPGDDEETLHVRISVGTFMRGRTEVLGSLEGDSGVPRVSNFLLISHDEMVLLVRVVLK